ncbi:ankyrin repeat domain-containing protein 26-like isoform X2 [Centruroides vittatus]|uniref:ankyrin repeat domain-containing protein 26-like isoform X2 n=1 Tax=Centruroides vittatus TaxID=120091 RepID=UPI00350EF4FC
MKKLLQWKRTIKGEKEKKRNSLSYNENDGYAIDLKHNESNLSKLHQACWTGDEEKVKKHLKRCDINLQDDDNRTPVHLAAARGHKNVLMTLLENNAKVNIQDSQGRTPLMKIVECGHIDLVVMLLEYGVDINIPDYHGDTALHISIDKEQSAITMILLQHKAEVNVKNDDGKTPLHLACCKKQLDVVKILLQRGADVNETDKKLQTPLILACKAKSSAIISLLLKNNAKCLLTDFTGQSALDYAYATGNSEMIDILNQYKTEEASTTDSQGINEHDVQKEENVEDSWKDVDISTKDLNSITKENIINKTPKHSLKLYNSEKQNEQNPLEKDEVLSFFQENETKNTEDIYSSPQKSIASLGLSQLKPLKRKDDDLFADLSFSDSTTSDNDNILEMIENKQGELKNEKVLHPSLYDKVIKTDGNNCNDFDSSDDDLNFEPYVPSVIDRKFSVDENQFKRPPLSRRSVSLDTSSPIKHTAVNEATNSNSKENSENLSSKPNTNLLVPDIKKNSSESEWDSEDSYNSYDNKNLKNSKTEDCIDAITQNNNNADKELNILESKKGILSEDENYVEPDSINPADLKDQISLEKSNSLNSDKDFSSSENSKNVNSGQTDHWSTLGRFGTMQGRDEMWENNAKIRKNSDLSSPPKNKINNPSETSKKKEYLLPEGGSLDEDSSTTITDTEDDKKKVNEVHLDPNEERDDTLSISTDEDLFLEEVCEKNESVHQHSISPSQLASLQGSLREHRLTVNKKSQKIKSLKYQLKTIQHEKIQIQEKIEKMSSSNSALRNNILEMKNQLTSLQYNLEEEKQVRENAEVLLNTMKERLSHKDDLFVNENNIRKSLENEIRTMKEQFKLIETNNQILQLENTKLKMQLEQEKLLSIDQRKSAKPKPETAEKSIITEMELEKQEQESHLVKINNELQLENEELKEKIKKLEDDLNNKVAELSGKLEVVQDKKNQIENQLQILDKELQKKQYELNKSIEMHNVHIKGIEFEKEELRKEAKSELDKRLALENKAIETFEEINKLNSECQHYKQMVEALKISSVKESENYEVLEKLRIENQDLKRELNDIKKLCEYTENITTQEKEAAKNTLSCINDELQKTKIQLDDKSVKILELQKSIRERDQSAFEKDLKFNDLEKENSYLNQKVDKLQQRFLAQQKELNFLKLESEDNGNNSAELCAKNEILNKQIDSLKLEKFQLEEELAKEKDYSNMLNSKIDTFKKNEDKIHQQIHLLKAEKNTLQEKLSKENEHCHSLHQQLKSFNEKEELLNEKVDMLQMQNKQLEDELSKEKEHSSMLDNKLETFNQNLKKMEMLVESLQAAKEELESKLNVEGSFNNNLSSKEIICTNHSSPDDNSVFQLTEKLKVMEHAKEKTEMLLQKEREKSYKVMKLKQSSDILLEQENFRIHQLMDIISKLKTELAMSNNKIKSLDNFTHDLEQRYQREEWRTKIDDLNKQIEQLQKEMGVERNLRYEAESKCSLLETELHSLRTIQTTLIEELLNELKSAKSQNKDQRMETSPIESGYKQLENRNHKEIYHVLRDISLQLRKNQQQKPESPEKNDFIKTKNKLMKELSQLQSSIISKGQEYDILEQERDLLQRKYEFDNSKNPVQDIETPVKLSSENERSNVSFLNYVPDRRWSSISSLNNMPIDRRNSSDIHLQPKDPPSLRNSFSVIHTPTNLQLLKEKDHNNSNKVLPEFQIKLDNAIARHLNSGPRIDISIPPRHKKDDESAKNYLSALKKKYFVFQI